jgi:hypothetical protein
MLDSTIKRIEEVLRENFKLKREIAAEKKRYLDLSAAFVDLKSQLKEVETQQISSTRKNNHSLSFSSDLLTNLKSQTPRLSPSRQSSS